MRTLTAQRWCHLLLVIGLSIETMKAIPAPSEEPRWMTLKLTDLYTGVDVEYEQESTSSGGSKTSADVDRLYLAPLFGGGANGSIYHPNLLSYDLHAEVGYNFQQYNTSTAGGSVPSRTENSILQRYDFTGVILRSKPYSISFQATKSHDHHDIDIFNSVTVDSESYGVNLGYRTGPVPVTVSYRHIDEQQTDLFYDNSLRQDNVEMRARNERGLNSTDLYYTFGQYDRTTADIFHDSGTFHYLSLYDTEIFGRRQQMKLNSSLSYDRDDTSFSPSDNFFAKEDLTVEHTPTFMSLYDYSFNVSSSGPADSVSHFARAGIQHQLYESLTSTFDVHGDVLDSSGPFGSSSLQRYGVGGSEFYNKRLGTWGNLSIGNSATFDVENRDNTGAVLHVLNETHTLVDGRTEFLRQPRVIIVTRVTDSTGTKIYRQGIDYELISIGDLTEIRRMLTSLNLPNNSAIVVTYQTESQPSGSFTTLSDQFSVRLDLFNNLLGIYSRLGWIENSDADRFLLENLFTTQSGVESTWRWLHAGAEYETRNSTLVSYDAVSLFETLTFQPGEGQTLSFDTRQRWTTFDNPHDSVTDYTFVARYFLRYGSCLNYTAEGGLRLQNGNYLDQNLATARTEVDFHMGKLRTVLGYQFNNDDIHGELRQRHFMYLQIRRSF